MVKKARVAWAGMCYGCCYSARVVSGVKRNAGASGRANKWDYGAGWSTYSRVETATMWNRWRSSRQFPL